MLGKYGEFNNKWAVVEECKQRVLHASIDDNGPKLRVAKADLIKAIEEANAIYPNTKGLEHLHFDKYGKRGEVT